MTEQEEPRVVTMQFNGSTGAGRLDVQCNGLTAAEALQVGRAIEAELVSMRMLRATTQAHDTPTSDGSPFR